MGWEQREERRSVLPTVLPQPSGAAASSQSESAEEPEPAQSSLQRDHTHLKE